jgi:hypothetical protein
MRKILVITLIMVKRLAYSNFVGYIKQNSEGAGTLFSDSKNT